MADRDRKPLTLRERAWSALRRKWRGAGTPTEIETACFIAGWHARGRADRLAKAVVDAAKIYCATEREKLAAKVTDGKSHWARLSEAVANLERAKSKGRK